MRVGLPIVPWLRAGLALGLGCLYLCNAGPALGRHHRTSSEATQPSGFLSPGCDDLDADSLVKALDVQLPALQKQTTTRLRFGRTEQTPAQYAESTLLPLRKVALQGRESLCRALQQRFELVRLAGPAKGHFSAYYHPIVRGRRTPQGRYQVPLYLRPPPPSDSHTTAEILAGALIGQRLEVAYLDSWATALNVHIEGSVTVQLQDVAGSEPSQKYAEINLTTDGHNGHPYQNPFKLARQDKVVPEDQPTQPGQSKARAFFDEHPELLRTYWAKNPHFVFFKETPLRGTGRFGELVAGRSLAVDPKVVPMGSVLWFRTELAQPGETASAAVRMVPTARLGLAQDTGAAIQGVGRVDIFVGSGDAARVAATFTSRPGELYLLVAKSARKKPQRHRSARRR